MTAKTQNEILKDLKKQEESAALKKAEQAIGSLIDKTNKISTKDTDEYGYPKTFKRRKLDRSTLGARNVLKAPDNPGFRRRFVNIDPDNLQRVEDLQARGYRIVKGDVPTRDLKAGADSPVGGAVVRSVGLGKKAVLMEIREDWYNEDQSVKQSKLDEQEKALKRVPEGFTQMK